MIPISKKSINENGGLLITLRNESYRYLQNILKSKRLLKKIPVEIRNLDRTIVHTHPHLDEYFADLLIRSALPTSKMNIEFKELSIQSIDNDSTCKAYFPNAIVMGIGSMVAGGAKALKVYDEHLDRGKKSHQSCSDIVSKSIFKKVPWSIGKILTEVNQIDASGGAHPQHIGNIIKATHQVRSVLKRGRNYRESIKQWVSPEWKKTIMDTAITSIIYCLEEKIDLREYTSEQDKILKKSLEHFQIHSPFAKDKHFKTTINRVRDIYLNQKLVYKQARLPNIEYSSQLLILGRVCFALNKCWGENIAQIIMTSFWETIYQSQLVFNELTFDLNNINTSNDFSEHLTKYGIIRQKSIYNSRIKAEDSKRIKIPKSGFHNQIWFIEIDPTPRLLMGNRPLINYLNKKNMGFGVMFVNDRFNCSKAIFRGSTFPYFYWEKLIDRICELEPKSWHKVKNEETKQYASFVINGNPAHQYVPSSELELEDITNVINSL